MAPRKPDLHWIEKALDGPTQPGQPNNEDRDGGRGADPPDHAIRGSDQD
jgi:hypothetical protein